MHAVEGPRIIIPVNGCLKAFLQFAEFEKAVTEVPQGNPAHTRDKGVFRLREKFAARTSCFAQDDNWSGRGTGISTALRPRSRQQHKFGMHISVLGDRVHGETEFAAPG